MYISSVLYSIIFALSMERTWLTFHYWIYSLYIIAYVTNKNLESWILKHINQTLSKVISFLFDEDVIVVVVVVVIILLFYLIYSQFQNTTSVSAFIIFFLAGSGQDFPLPFNIDYRYYHYY